MVTIKTAEQIRADALAKAEKEIAKANIEAAIFESLPDAVKNPRFIHVYSLYQTVGSVSYDVKTKAEAFEIFRHFEILPSYVCRDSCVSIKPYDDEKAREVTEILAAVEIDSFKAKLRFFTHTQAGIVRIEVEMPVHLFGAYKRDNPRAVKHYVYQWHPMPKTCEMHNIITYASAAPTGEHSAKHIVYALYEAGEVENQFCQQ